MKNINLRSLGLEKGQLYESLISTTNENGEKNAAPMGVLCKNEHEIVLYLYHGSQTKKNILKSSSFVVNLTQDALLFTKSTLGDLPSYYFYDFNGYPVLRDSDAFIIAIVTQKKDIIRENKMGSSKMTVVTARAEKVVKNKECVFPLNRGIYAVIESLIHFTRLELGNPETRQKLYLKIKEMNRVVQKVGSESEKRSLKYILESIKQKFDDLD